MPEAPPEWKPSRLFTTAGLRGANEQEVRASAALMSIIGAVPEFGKALLKPLGSTGGNVQTFTEVVMKTRSNDRLRPDGVVVLSRGRQSWGCLVEVKTGNAELTSKQVESYIRLARYHGYDAVLTVSNQLSGRADELPYKINKVVQGNTAVHHISWWKILTEARRAAQENRIADSDQAWLLAELIRYLADEKSGCAGLDGMGSSWVKVREGISNQTISRRDAALPIVVQRWEQLNEYIALLLSQELETDVTLRLARGAEARHRRAVDRLIQEGSLLSELRIEGAAGPLMLEADLRASQIRAASPISAPGSGQVRGRIGWLMRQLKDAPDDLRIDVAFERAQKTASATIAQAREDGESLRFPEDRQRLPRQFTLRWTRSFGAAAGRGRNAFVDSIIGVATDFYREVLQDVRAWQAAPPQLGADEVSPDAARRGA